MEIWSNIKDLYLQGFHQQHESNNKHGGNGSNKCEGYILPGVVTAIWIRFILNDNYRMCL